MKKKVLIGIIAVVITAVAVIAAVILLKKDNDENIQTDVSCFKVEEGEIIAYDSSCGDKVRVPSEINGVKITSIAKYVFKETGLTRVVFDEGIEEIGIGAFQDNSISQVKFPNSVKIIKPMAFYNNKITKLELPEKMERIGVKAFNKNMMSGEDAFIYLPVENGYDNTILIGYAGEAKEVEIPSQVRTVYLNAMSECGIEKVTLNEGVERIEANSFSDNNLKEVTIPSSVIIVSEDAFGNNPNLKIVNVKGKTTLEEFAAFDETIKDLVKFN